MMDTSPQQFFLLVTKHVSTFCGENKILHIWRVVTNALCPCFMILGFQEDTCHQLHLSEKEGEEVLMRTL